MADDDVIYVDVVPRLDESAADGVEESLKDKLKNATEGLGDGLKQATRDAFDQLKDAVDTEELGRAVGQSLGNAVGEQLGDVLPKEIGDSVQDALSGRKSWSEAAGSAAGQMLAPVLRDTLGDTITDALGGAVDDALSGKKSWGQALGSAAGNVIGDTLREQLGSEVTDHLQNITQGLQGLGGFRGGRDIAGGLGGVQTLLGEIDQIGLGNEAHSSESVLGTVSGVLGNTAAYAAGGAALGSVFPGAGNLIGGGLGAAFGFGKGIYDAVNGEPSVGPPEGDLVSGYNTDTLYQGVFGGGGGGGGGGTTSAAEVDVQSSVATVSAGSVTLGGNISLPAGLISGGGGHGYVDANGSALGSTGGGSLGSSSGGVSVGSNGGGQAAIPSSGGSGLGSSGSFSGFSEGGDVTGSGPTGVDSVLAMLAPGERVLTPSQNDAWKSIQHFAGGGEPAVPAAPASSGDEAMDAVGQSGEGGSSDQSSGSDQGSAPGATAPSSAPGDAQGAPDQAQDAIGQNTDVVDPTQEGLAGGTKTSKGIQDQSYGYGKGFQVTGQGLIGFAESAPGAIASAAAAGAGYDGSGAASGAIAAALTSAWNTIGEPEMNEAITEGVKAGADLLSAPSQELAVGGENFQNWSQKLIGGEIGNVTNLINTAANTQAPLTPQQGGQSQGAPGAAGQAGQLGGQQSPQGTPNDPMHVNIVGGNQSGSQQSSAMSSVGMDSSGPT